jgi:hypothetical protein
MRLRPHRRDLVIWNSSAGPASRYGAPQYKRRLARTGRIRRCVRIGVLLTTIAVRPRWRPLLAGTVLTVTGVMQNGAGVVVLVPGLLLLWHALLIPASRDAGRERRSRLERELAAFSTPAQRCDLEATLNRYPDGITYEIRDILVGQATAARNEGVPVTGRY